MCNGNEDYTVSFPVLDLLSTTDLPQIRHYLASQRSLDSNWQVVQIKYSFVSCVLIILLFVDRQKRSDVVWDQFGSLRFWIYSLMCTFPVKSSLLGQHNYALEVSMWCWVSHNMSYEAIASANWLEQYWMIKLSDWGKKWSRKLVA